DIGRHPSPDKRLRDCVEAQYCLTISHGYWIGIQNTDNVPEIASKYNIVTISSRIGRHLEYRTTS
ncbi:hypothetical protein AVEN_222397-1, partial [Araneus ventricosus]